MKRLVVLLTVVAAFAFSSTAYATITNAWWYDDGDGAVYCSNWSWNSGASTLWMAGRQYNVPGLGTTGHMVGGILTDSDLDPILNLGGTIQNDTGGAWLGYTINVIMNMPFSFYPPTPSVDNPPYSDGWYLAGVGAPTLQVSGPWAGYYLGDLVFSQGLGTAIGVGDVMDFSYSISFSGATSFSFIQEMIPSFTYIPEPSGFVLAGVGGLMLALRRRRNRPPAA